MTGVVILAAGSSSRLGRPKQNLEYQGKTLLQMAIDTAFSAGCEPVVVVLGAATQQILPGINHQKVRVVHNLFWEEGMASSIRSGINEMMLTGQPVSRVIILLTDQPFVTSSLLLSLIERQSSSGKKIIACAYNDTLGPPALFHSTYFSELKLLHGKQGAKYVFLKYPNDVESISFPGGAVDIDTSADYNELLKTDEGDEGETIA